MSALKALNFVAVPKHTANDPVQSRRNKLITQLEQQRELAKVWKTIWSAGQGVGAISEVLSVAELCDQFLIDYRSAMREAAQDPFI
jgi:NAD(P)H-dependent flavin oxidoreductase YrpB (nitropropane dioxygenase family)